MEEILPLPDGFRTLEALRSQPSLLVQPRAALPSLAWAGRLSVLAAREKEGKSTLASSGASAVASGRTFLGQATIEGLVVWVALEEHPADVVQRFTRFDANPSQVVIAEKLKAPLKEIECAARELRPVLIVIDTLAALAADLVRDPSSSSEWTKVMSRLARIARETDTAVLVLHHSRKSDGQYRDSSAIGAGCDVMLEMDTPPDATTGRRIRGRGRIHVEREVLVRLIDNRFELSEGQGSVDDEVLAVVTVHPGLSKREVRNRVSRRGAEVDEALERLLNASRVVNDGDGTRHAYHVALDTASDTGGERPCPEVIPPGQDLGHTTGHDLPAPCPEPKTLGGGTGHASESWTLDVGDE